SICPASRPLSGERKILPARIVRRINSDWASPICICDRRLTIAACSTSRTSIELWRLVTASRENRSPLSALKFRPRDQKLTLFERECIIKSMIWILSSLTVLILADMLVISVVYHRYLTHRSVDLNKWVARALTLYIQGMAFAPPFTWVASHVAHHAHTDTPLDPYSPRVHGFWQVLFLTPLLVTRWRRRYGATITARYTRRVPDRRFYAACNRGWWCLSISSGFALGFFLLFGWPGLLVYVFQFYGFYVVKGWINSVGHTFGERPYRNSGANRRGVISSLLNL